MITSVLQHDIFHTTFHRAWRATNQQTRLCILLLLLLIFNNKNFGDNLTWHELNLKKFTVDFLQNEEVQ